MLSPNHGAQKQSSEGDRVQIAWSLRRALLHRPQVSWLVSRNILKAAPSVERAVAFMDERRAARRVLLESKLRARPSLVQLVDANILPKALYGDADAMGSAQQTRRGGGGGAADSAPAALQRSVRRSDSIVEALLFQQQNEIRRTIEQRERELREQAARQRRVASVTAVEKLSRRLHKAEEDDNQIFDEISAHLHRVTMQLAAWNQHADAAAAALLAQQPLHTAAQS
jgi:hypothetical protein